MWAGGRGPAVAGPAHPMWWALPREHRAVTAQTLLDGVMPRWQFGERHQVTVNAPPARVLAAVRQVTAGEISLFRALTWIRRFGRPGPAGILNAPAGRPILHAAAESGFLLLEEAADREVVFGVVLSGAPPRTPEEFRRAVGRGVVKAAINFHAAAAGGASRVTTETRIWTADAGSRRRFAAYWALVYPGSAIIRRMWLRAIKRRAERPTESP